MQPQVQDLSAIIAELDPAYAPQRALFQQQQALLPGQQAAAIGGLDAAKLNTFRDINTNANSKGLAFSGVPVAEQTRYVGEKYLPARAGVESDFQKQGFALSQALAGLQGEQRLKALDTRSGQQKVLDAYMEAEKDRAFKMQMQREQIAAENSRAAAGRASQSAPKLTKNARGGWDVSDGYDLAGYARATGADLITLLSQGDEQDRQAAKWYVEKIDKYGTQDADKYFRELMRDRPTAFYKGG